MRMALADAGAIGPVQKIPTPRNPEDAVAAMEAFLKEQAAQPQDAVGGIAGIIRDGVVIDSPNLREWDGFAMGARLHEVINVPVQLFNDAELAGIAEARMGAGNGYGTVLYLTIGTGMGGVVVTDGTATALEPGRQFMEQYGRTLESLVGGAALTKEFGTVPEHLARDVFNERSAALAAGIDGLIREWSPDIIVLNGALMNEETAFRIQDIERELLKLMDGQVVPPLTLASFGDESALHGAASVA